MLIVIILKDHGSAFATLDMKAMEQIVKVCWVFSSGISVKVFFYGVLLKVFDSSTFLTVADEIRIVFTEEVYSFNIKPPWFEK